MIFSGSIVVNQVMEVFAVLLTVTSVEYLVINTKN